MCRLCGIQSQGTHAFNRHSESCVFLLVPVAKSIWMPLELARIWWKCCHIYQIRSWQTPTPFSGDEKESDGSHNGVLDLSNYPPQIPSWFCIAKGWCCVSCRFADGSFAASSRCTKIYVCCLVLVSFNLWYPKVERTLISHKCNVFLLDVALKQKQLQRWGSVVSGDVQDTAKLIR